MTPTSSISGERMHWSPPSSARRASLASCEVSEVGPRGKGRAPAAGPSGSNITASRCVPRQSIRSASGTGSSRTGLRVCAQNREDAHAQTPQGRGATAGQRVSQIRANAVETRHNTQDKNRASGVDIVIVTGNRTLLPMSGILMGKIATEHTAQQHKRQARFGHIRRRLWARRSSVSQISRASRAGAGVGPVTSSFVCRRPQCFEGEVDGAVLLLLQHPLQQPAAVLVLDHRVGIDVALQILHSPSTKTRGAELAH